MDKYDMWTDKWVTSYYKREKDLNKRFIKVGSVIVVVGLIVYLILKQYV